MASSSASAPGSPIRRSSTPARKRGSVPIDPASSGQIDASTHADEPAQEGTAARASPASRPRASRPYQLAGCSAASAASSAAPEGRRLLERSGAPVPRPEPLLPPEPRQPPEAIERGERRLLRAGRPVLPRETEERLGREVPGRVGGRRLARAAPAPPPIARRAGRARRRRRARRPRRGAPGTRAPARRTSARRPASPRSTGSSRARTSPAGAARTPCTRRPSARAPRSPCGAAAPSGARCRRRTPPGRRARRGARSSPAARAASPRRCRGTRGTTRRGVSRHLFGIGSSRSRAQTTSASRESGLVAHSSSIARCSPG